MYHQDHSRWAALTAIPTLQIGGGAALSVLAGAVLSPNSGAAPLLWVMLGSAMAALAAALYIFDVARRAGEL